jgi:hypothetical protein
MFSCFLHSCSLTVFHLFSWFLLVCSLSFSSLLLCSQSYCLLLLRTLIATYFPTSCSNCLFQVLSHIPCSPCSLLLLDPSTCYSLFLQLAHTACSHNLFFSSYSSLVPIACSFFLLLLLALIDLLLPNLLFLCIVLTACSTAAQAACSITSFCFAIIFFYTFPFKSMPSNSNFTFPLWLQVRPSQRPTPKWLQPLLQPLTVLQKANRNFPHFEA